MSAAPGERWPSDLEVFEELGRGMHGTVYAAHHRPSGQACALKLFRLPHEGDAERFRREVGILRRLEHPGIARLIEVGVHAGTLFHLTELVPGGSLEAAVQRSGPFSPARALDLARDVAEALAYAHDRGVIHRDLKPANVLLGADGHARVVDFGLAKERGLAELTRTGMLLGTPLYAAPEQLEDARRVDERADVYGLGTLLHFLASGRPPYAVQDLDALFAAVFDGPRPLLGAGDLDEPACSAINELLLNTLAVNPEARYPTMRTCADAIARTRARLPAPPRSSPAPPPAVPGSSFPEDPAPPAGPPPAKLDAPTRVDAPGPRPRPRLPRPGEQVGPYRVDELLGEGGMGAVFAARDTRLGRQVALKLLHPGAGPGRWRFAEEARSAALLNHPGIVHLYEVELAAEPPYLVMERVVGPTLEQRLERGPKLALPELLDLVTALASAVAHAHARGVLHRDLKPSNVLLGEAGPKLTDFGIARRVDRATLTQEGNILGSPLYMAKEQLEGNPLPASDLHALGVLLYELLTGRVPFEGPTVYRLFAQIARGKATPPSAVRPEVPPQLDALVASLLAPDPADRPPSAEALAAALTDIRARLTGPAPAPARGPSALAVLAALAALVLLTLAGLGLSRLSPPRSPGPETSPSPESAPPSPGDPVLRRFDTRRDFKHQAGEAEVDGWACRPGRDQPGFLAFGPYLRNLPPGNYAVGFQLLIDQLAIPPEERALGTTLQPMVTLEVADVGSEQILAQREVSRLDFAQPHRYQELSLTFRSAPGQVLEFRSYWSGRSYLRQGQVFLRGVPAPVREPAAPYEPLVFEAERDLLRCEGRPEGDGWAAYPGEHRQGHILNGPFSQRVPPGRNRARFRLLAHPGSVDAFIDLRIATLEVYDTASGATLAKAHLLRSDLGQPGVYREHLLEFVAPPRGMLEFRVSWHGKAPIQVDRVVVESTRAPAGSAGE